MERMLVEMLIPDSAASRRIRERWREYEDRQTPESRFVKDLDRFELGLQAVEYESRGVEGSSARLSDMTNAGLQPFLDSTQPKIESDEVKAWSSALLAEREQRHAPSPAAG